MWEAERQKNERLQEIRSERDADRVRTQNTEADQKSELESLKIENDRLKRQVDALSSGEDGKYLEKLKANLQRIRSCAEAQWSEKKRLEEDRVKLMRDIKCPKDELVAAQQISVETQLRQLEELQCLTEENRELKERLSELRRQQQQPAAQEHHQGNFPIQGFIDTPRDVCPLTFEDTPWLCTTSTPSSRVTVSPGRPMTCTLAFL